MRFELGQKIIDKLRNKKLTVYVRSKGCRMAEKLNVYKTENPKNNYSVLITTYDKRFQKYLVPLIHKIRECFDGEIILTVNGNYAQEFNEEYRKNLMQFLATVDKVYPIIFTEFRSLGKMWNYGIINSSCENVLVLNDDLIIEDNVFFDDVNNAIEQANGNSFKINNSWSHLIITKKDLQDIGYFDERFLSIGWEDDDFENRYFLQFNKYFKSINGIRGINNVSDEEDCSINQKTFKNSKYSAFNKAFYEKKYEATLTKRVIQHISDKIQYPYEKFYLEHKNEL